MGQVLIDLAVMSKGYDAQKRSLFRLRWINGESFKLSWIVIIKKFSRWTLGFVPRGLYCLVTLYGMDFRIGEDTLLDE